MSNTSLDNTTYDSTFHPLLDPQRFPPGEMPFCWNYISKPIIFLLLEAPA